MTAKPDVQSAPLAPPQPLTPPREEHEPAPVGTLFLMMIFLAAIAGMWGLMYWTLLSR